MAKQELEAKKDDILRKLRDAGASGLSKGRLGIAAGKGAGAQALRQLERERRVGNLGTRTKTLYVLMDFYKPLELACDQIEVRAKREGAARSGVAELFSQRELERGCLGQVRKKVAEGIDWLVKERKLLKFKRGKAVYFVHASRLELLLAGRKGERAEASEALVRLTRLDRASVLSAYRRLTERLGYSNVEIFQLQRELDAPMEEVKAFLLEESRKGNAVFSLGDWSVSSEAVRSGVVELYGRPHLLVRFRE